MITLDILGILDSTPTFKRDHLSMDEIKRIYWAGVLDVYYVQENIQLAKKNNRPEVVRALELSLRYTQSVNRKLAWANQIPVIVLGAGRRRWKRPMPIRRVVWLFTHYLKKWIVRRALCWP